MFLFNLIKTFPYLLIHKIILRKKCSLRRKFICVLYKRMKQVFLLLIIFHMTIFINIKSKFISIKYDLLIILIKKSSTNLFILYSNFSKKFLDISKIQFINYKIINILQIIYKWKSHYFSQHNNYVNVPYVKLKNILIKFIIYLNNLNRQKIAIKLLQICNIV